MEEKFKFTVTKSDEGCRIDKFLVQRLSNYTRSAIQKNIKEGNILINDRKVKPNYKLRSGDVIAGHAALSQEGTILAEEIEINVLYEDDDLMVVNKDSGMVVHPAPGHYSGTLVNALLHYTKGNLSSIGEETRPGIVHRLDKDTSGIMMVAKSDRAHEKLANMFHDYEITRKYHTIVWGNFKEDEGMIQVPIGRHPVDRKKMTVGGTRAREALTFYRVIRQFRGFSYLEVILHTGRMHQIRVHMEHIGHPVLGDLVYGPKKQPYSSMGQLLHAKELGFNHPITNEFMVIESPLPDYFQRVIDTLPKI